MQRTRWLGRLCAQRWPRMIAGAVSCSCVLLVGSAHADSGPVVADGLGDVAAGGSYQHLSAAGQPGAVGTSMGSGLHHAAGFLHVFQLGSGPQLSREINPDNDGDGLWDESEMRGDGFDPPTITGFNVSDSDGDGVPDGDEARAGTDPLDAWAYLHIDGLTPVGDSESIVGSYTNEFLEVVGYTQEVLHVTGHRLTWDARSGRSYRILKGSSLRRPQDFIAIAEMTAPGPGAGPWQVVPLVWTNPASGELATFLSLRLVP